MSTSVPPEMVVAPQVLVGTRVRLEPLDLARHERGLVAIGLEPELWTWTTTRCDTEADLGRYLRQALDDAAAGRALPFATIDVASGAVAGCTRFGNIAPEHRRVEIGWTWVGRAFRRSHVNTEAKYLMFTHAFEHWGCVRVELKTDVRNERSRAAMRRIGCVEEGVLRRHMRRANGEFRDSVYYSVTDDEWPAVRARLVGMMSR